MKILVITPVSRPDNLLAIYNSLATNNTTPIEIEWYVVFDLAIKDQLKEWEDRIQANGTRNIKVHFYLSDRANCVAGHYHRNFILEILLDKAKGNLGLFDAWICQLDDDNILHPSLAAFMYSQMHILVTKDVFLFAQILRNGATRLQVTKIEVGLIDTAMMMARLKAIGTIRYDDQDYCADGHFIKEVCKQSESKTFIYNQPLCYYNYLRS
jgi:hypothetical protein